MSSSTSSPTQSGRPLGSLWQSVAPFVAPPLAAAGAIVLPFRFFVQKTYAQQGVNPVPSLTLLDGVKRGLSAMRPTGTLVGSQMVVQNLVEKALKDESNKESLSLKLVSSAIVGAVSSPFVAIFNSKGMGWNWSKSLRNFSVPQGLAITAQETAFVFGLSIADKLSNAMKQKFGDNKAVECTAAFTAGALGSLAGHPANTALTLWQSGMKVVSLRQLWWGASLKGLGVGFFAVLYTLGKKTLNPSVKNSHN